jgi:hypothetical protein
MKALKPFGFFYLAFSAFFNSSSAVGGKSNLPLSGFSIIEKAARAPRRPKPPMVQYDALQPIFLIKIIVIDDRAIPTKLAPDSIELAVLLLSYGK